MAAAQDTFYYVPHTHWEGAVFKTREQYLEMGLPIILKALKLLRQYPSYRFTLDQACFVKPFLERYPQEEPAVRQFIAEGRLAIVGGTDTMPDVNMPGGETFVRQMLYGKGYFRQALGVDVTTGWLLDTFGHHAQMPQLLRLAGFRSHWFFRGVADWDVPSEFLWEGLDGTRIPAFWLVHSYAHLYGAPRTLAEFTAFVRQRYEALAPFSRGPGRVGLAGVDVGDPEEHSAPLTEEFNQQQGQPFRLQLAVPAEVEAAMATRSELPIVSGELNPIFQGIYSSRIELKQRTRELEGLLGTAERLGGLLRGLGLPSDDATLWRAWEPMLFNHAHDLLSGVMTDPVYEDTLRGYDFSRRLAEEQLELRLATLVGQIDTRGEGIPLVVFNPLAWVRTDVVQATIGLSEPGRHSLRLLGPDGAEVPVQTVDTRCAEDGSLLQASIVFVAQDVPGLGTVTYRVLPRAEGPPPHLMPPGPSTVLENEYCRLTVEPCSGAITGLRVKTGDWEALRAPGNVVAMEQDHGDFWEPYRPLDGASRIAMKDRHGPPQPGQAVFSTDQAGAVGTVTRGPVFSEFTVSHPFSAKGHFRTRIRLFQALPRIEIRTTILNQDSAVRYRVLFPTAIARGESTHEIPFGASRRPEGIEFPAQTWVDWGGEGRGMALLNRGLPGNTVDEGTLMLSLLRSTQIVAYGIGGGYEGQGSGSGLELGKELTFDYALLPHAGDWRQATVWQEGHAFGQPLLARAAGVHAGPLPARSGFLRVSHPNVVVSALKPGEGGGAILRVYEAAGVASAGVTIELPGGASRPSLVNLMEDPLEPVVLTGSQIRLDLRPFEIKTIRFGFDREIRHREQKTANH
jgi:alpha-mannosidase